MGNRSELTDLGKLFWFLDFKKLDAKRDRNLIVHQVLAYGSLEDIRKLLDFYGREKVREEFLEARKGLYDRAVLRLVSLILKCPIEDENYYIKEIYADK